MTIEPLNDSRCKCALCQRHRRADYITRKLRRDGDDIAAGWLDRVFDHLLDVEFELEGMRRAD